MADDGEDLSRYASMVDDAPDRAAFAEKTSRLSVEMPFDGSENLDGSSIVCEGEPPLGPFRDPSELADPAKPTPR